MPSYHPTRRHDATAFTLIELLVVISIISLLISILLPALARARSSANNITCLSHLRQIGTALFTYASENKNSLPVGYYDGKLGAGYDGANATDWAVLINNIMSGSGSTFATDTGGSGRQILKDTDTLEGGSRHYSAHPRLMPNPDTTDSAPSANGATLRPYRIDSIFNPSKIVGIMDGNQVKDDYNSSMAMCESLDSYALWSGTIGTYLLDTYKPNILHDSITGGNNLDQTAAGFGFPSGNIRWRHLSNAIANFLHMDGHASSQRYNHGNDTTLLRENINVNPY
jgi:prepilin-type N-terminal cleavage/methylation domain-containing protein/prepilin-type processing-associated H-X9-DG protein